MKIFLLITIVVSMLFGWGYESMAKNLLSNTLKDSESAKFRNLMLGQSDTLCGEVNAKNGFGAYTGYKHFLGKGNLVFLRGQIDDKTFVEVWNKLCK